MDSQRIFILVKPDGVERGLVGEILGRIEAKGYKLEDLRYMRAKEEVLRVHYAHLADKPFFPEIVRYMTRGRRHEPDSSRSRFHPRRPGPRMGSRKHREPHPRLRF